MIVEEGRVIKDNPLRILGVYSDTPKKEIVANLGKLRAFAKTGKILSFDSDFTSLLGPVNRTKETIEKANSEISLPKDKLQAGMFWFMQHTDNDKAATECLKNGGDPNEALTIIQKKGNYSGIINMAVLSLVLKRWDLALYSYAYLLESDVRRGALVKAFTDTEDYYSEDDLVDYISSKLIQEYPNAHWIDQLQHENVELGDKTYPFKSRFQESKLLINLSKKCTDRIIEELESILKLGSSIPREDAKANLKFIEEIKDKLKEQLKDLRIVLGKTNSVYIKTADKVANLLLNCCINYYNNDVDNPFRARNVLKYTRMAYRIAEGGKTKGRMKDNLDIIEHACENLMPELIEDEYNAIDKLVMDYHEVSKTKDYTEHLYYIIEEAYKLITTIKNKVGQWNKHYIDISSNFVGFALQEVRLKKKNTSHYTTLAGRLKYNSALQWARQIMDLLAKFDMDDNCQLEYDMLFTDILDSLSALKPKQTYSGTIQTNSTTIPNTQTSKPSNSQSTQKSTTKKNYQYGRTNYKNTESSKESPERNQDNNLGVFICFVLILIAVIILFLGFLSANKEKKQKVETVANTVSSSTQSTTSPENDIININDDNVLSNTTPSINNNVKEESYRTVQYNTGDKPYVGKYGKGRYDYDTDNSLLIRNGSSTDAVVFLESLNGKKVRHVYIRKGENFNMTNIPGGKYIMKVMQGTDWNPDKDNGAGNPKGGFMYSCSISKSESYDPFDYPYPSSGRYSQGEVTLYKVQNGNMQTEAINENELF